MSANKHKIIPNYIRNRCRGESAAEAVVAAAQMYKLARDALSRHQPGLTPREECANDLRSFSHVSMVLFLRSVLLILARRHVVPDLTFTLRLYFFYSRYDKDDNSKS
ncbi:hypothetical protein EVAR_84394_1 [Eumeta japonica]|uniref:Uncharacterized protein n=1 Tax=Eumeta variegata TaxID=151549 RepID=A0A4C1YHQ0_EUMVA|nr:hypothetical protein EVAR_84394_1 [Eumeta japonica]